MEKQNESFMDILLRNPKGWRVLWNDPAPGLGVDGVKVVVNIKQEMCCNDAICWMRNHIVNVVGAEVGLDMTDQDLLEDFIVLHQALIH